MTLEAEAIARDSRVPWPTRCLAALVFETLLSRNADKKFWTARLGADDDVWRRLARNRRIHETTSYDEFVAFSRQECRLTFARYLFSAGDVIAQIERHLRRGVGERDLGPHGQFAAEAERAVAALPAMERAIVEHLAAGVWWVAPHTPQAINALVENPAGTVVVTIKPPGSDVEIEIKRAGRPRARPLTVRRHRVPSHRLDGGSMYRHLVFEAKNSAFLSRVYREIHGVEAPISRTVAISRLRPVGGYRPAQAIQLGTTSFRLDVVERALRGRRNAEIILDEIVDDGRAGKTYLSLMQQIGTFWGTVLGLCGYSQGESFVVRNVGLRNVGGRVRVIFMDHDALSFASVCVDAFDPAAIEKMQHDATHVRRELAILRRIYGVSPAVERRGLARFRSALTSAYARTRDAMWTMPHYFRPSFLATLPDLRFLASIARRASAGRTRRLYRRRRGATARSRDARPSHRAAAPADRRRR